jgi:hypothetical protein
VDSSTALRAGEMLEAMLLAPILRPMIAGDEMLGEYELDLVAREIAERDSHGFASLVAASLERAR